MVTSPIQVRCFDSFAQARAAAGNCLDGGAQPGPFDRLGWFEALHMRAFASAEPRILHARSGCSQAWFFLTSADQGTLEGIANWYSFIFRPQFVDAPDRRTRAELLEAMAIELRGMGHQLSLYPLVEDGQVDAALFQRAFRAAGWSVVARIMGRKRQMKLAPDTDFETYWAARPGSLRSTFRRKAHRHPIDVTIHRHIDDVIWADLEAIFAASWKPEGDDFAFLRDFAWAEASAGRLRLGFARLGGQTVAVELWTVEDGRAYIHKLAFDERFADKSPGTQLSHAMFRQAIDGDQARFIDFGTGDNGYKAAWMPESVPIWQIDAFDLRHPASWRPAITIWMSALHQPDRLTVRPEMAKGSARRAALAGR